MLRKDLKVDICGGNGQLAAYIHQHGTTLANTYCNNVEPGSAKFFFIPDLTAPATGAVLVVLIALYVGSQLLSSLLMSVTADKNQRYIMLALPFVFVLFIKNFPAGLLVYWITTNLWTVGQQYFIRRSTGQLPPWMPGSGGQPAATVPAMAGAAAIAAPTPRSSKGSKADPPPPPAVAPPPSPKRKKKKTGRRR